MKSHLLPLLRNHVFCSGLHPFDLRPVPQDLLNVPGLIGYRIELSDVEGDADCHLQFYPSRVAAGFLFPGVCPFDYIFGLRRHTNPDRYLNKNDANVETARIHCPRWFQKPWNLQWMPAPLMWVEWVQFKKYLLQLFVVPEAINSYLRLQRGWMSFLLPKAGTPLFMRDSADVWKQTWCCPLACERKHVDGICGVTSR